jgi:hypothetical protein
VELAPVLDVDESAEKTPPEDDLAE